MGDGACDDLDCISSDSLCCHIFEGGKLTALTGRPIPCSTAAAPRKITSVIDPLTYATQFAYEGRDLVSVTDPLGRATRSFADGEGQVTSVTDPLNHLTRYGYDDLNRLTTTTPWWGDWRTRWLRAWSSDSTDP